MIFTERTIKVNNDISTISNPIILYRGDYNVEVRFTILDCPYKYSENNSTNVIETVDAYYCQLVIKVPNDRPPIFSDIVETKEGCVIFTFSGEMIDESIEVGDYTFQIRLFDANQKSRATIPPVENGIKIREPIAFGDVTTTNKVGEATVGYAIATVGAPEDAFDSEGNYNKTAWVTGNRITAAKLNKIEAGIDGVNQKVASSDTRLDAIEAIDVAQNNRLDVIEAKNQQQDDRLLDIEKTNKRQDMDLKCLFTEAKNNMMDITEEGNNINLQNSTEGHVFIDELKGNTLVNCNKEPDKELILNGNIDTSGDNTVTLTEGVDGGLVDVALEGNTLVNVSKTKDSTALPLEEELTYLYANTQYTLQFVSDKAITADITLGGTELLAQSIVQGLNRISITTPETLVDNKLIIDGVGTNISEVVVTDTDREFRYFEGMKSVGECEELEVKSTNKNLFDTSLLKPISDATYGYYKFNPNGKSMTLSVTDKDTSIDISEVYIGFTEIGTTSTEDGIAWLIENGNIREVNRALVRDLNYISFYPNEQATLDKLFTRFNFQLEEGSTATDYIPHQSNTQQLTHEPVRAVRNVKDKYVLIDGKWYIRRSCGTATFDGSDDENWIVDNQGGDGGDTSNCTGFKIEIDDMIEISGSFGLAQTGVKLKCNLLPCTPTFNEKINGVDYGWGKFLFIKLDKNMNENEFRNNLKINPIEVIYPLETPVYEPIDYNPFEVYSDVTHISTNSAIPTNITVKNTGFNCLLKPSTTYTISSNLGLNTVTTGADIGDSCLRFMDTDTSDVTTMRDVLVLEGDWTTKADLIPASFSGIESAFEQELVTDEADPNYGKYKVTAKVVGKNLFKFGSALSGGIVRLENTDGTPILKAGTYTISSNCEKVYEDAPCIALLDANNTTIKMSNNNLMDNITFSSKHDIQVIFLYCNGYNYAQSYGKNYTFSNIQIEKGNTATEYEPYKENNIIFYIDEPLRGVGDVKDKVYVKDDKVVVQRNIGAKRLTSEDVTDYNRTSTGSNTKPNVKTIGFRIPNLKPSWGGLTTLCNKLKTGKIGKGDQTAIEHLYWGSEYNWIGCDDENNPHVAMTVDKTLLPSDDIDGARQYIDNEDIELVYQLAEPTYEEVEYNDTKLIIESFKNSTISYNSNVPVTSKLYYSYSVPLVDKVSQTANVTDQQDQLIIDLATQCAVMEMYLM